MPRMAFKDKQDGYYECDVPQGSPIPDWAVGMTPCAIVVPVKTAEQLEAMFTAEIQKRLDDFARTRGYDDMKSLVSYAGDPDPQFNKEGTYGKSVRSQTWATSRGILAAVTSGTRPMPTSIADIQADLPALVWPA